MASSLRNIASGLVASAGSVLVGLAVIPLYVHTLGAEGYGLVGLYLALQSLLQLFDTGLTSTASREIARARAELRMVDAVEVVRALAWLTGGAAVLITVLLLGAAPLAVAHWLNLERLSAAEATAALLIMALALGLRWPTGLYQHVLLGADQMATWSVISLTTTVFAHVGGVAVLAAGAGLTGFFLWQVAVAVGLFLWVRTAARHVLQHPQWQLPRWGVLGHLHGFPTTMVAVSAAGLGFMNLDKVVLSRMLPLGQFGEYMLASMIAGAVYAFVTPVFHWTYPRLSGLAARDPDRMQQEYRLVSHAVATVIFPLVAFLFLSGETLLALWLGDSVLAASVAPVLGIVAAGNALHGVMFIVYALTFARGAASLALRINVALLLLLAPLLVVMAMHFGTKGAAGAWLILHMLHLSVGSWLVHRAVLPGFGWSWLREDVAPGLLGSLFAAMAGQALLAGPLDGARPGTQLLLGSSLCAMAWLGTLACSPRMRQMAARLFVRVPA